MSAFIIKGIDKNQAKAVRKMNHRSFNEGYWAGTAGGLGGVAGGIAAVAARRYLTQFVVAAGEAGAAGFAVQAGTAAAAALTIAAPIAIGAAAGAGVAWGVEKIGQFFNNRSDMTRLTDLVEEGVLVPLTNKEEIESAVKAGTIVGTSTNIRTKDAEAALARLKAARAEIAAAAVGNAHVAMQVAAGAASAPEVSVVNEVVEPQDLGVIPAQAAAMGAA